MGFVLSITTLNFQKWKFVDSLFGCAELLFGRECAPSYVYRLCDTTHSTARETRSLTEQDMIYSLIRFRYVC